MKRWYFAASVGLALCSPAAVFAQGNGASGNTGFGVAGGGAAGTGRGNTSGGLAGNVNTTLLGDQVNLNFNSVFGTNATLANTTADVFAAYRPTGSGSGSGSGIGNTGMGNFSSGGLSTGTGLGSGLGGTNRTGGLGGNTGGLGGGGLGGLGGGARTGTGGLGAMGGGLGGGGLGGGAANRLGGMGGNTMTFGGNRGGTGGFLGGMGGFLGGGAGSFLGGGTSNQQAANAPIGYVVNFEGRNAGNVMSNLGTPTASTEFAQRLMASPGLQGTQNLKVFTRGQTAILEGQVSSDYARQLADAMIRLEPGVYDVENKLQIVAPKP